MDWGPDGKLWVVEMADYPLGTDDQGKPVDAVRYLEDTNGDGDYDKSTLFLDEIAYPTGVIAWRDGVIVSAAPSMFFAADRDGDGKAEVRKDLYRGFGEGNQQHRVNGLNVGSTIGSMLPTATAAERSSQLRLGKRLTYAAKTFVFAPRTDRSTHKPDARNLVDTEMTMAIGSGAVIRCRFVITFWRISICAGIDSWHFRRQSVTSRESTTRSSFRSHESSVIGLVTSRQLRERVTSSLQHAARWSTATICSVMGLYKTRSRVSRYTMRFIDVVWCQVVSRSRANGQTMKRLGSFWPPVTAGFDRPR